MNRTFIGAIGAKMKILTLKMNLGNKDVGFLRSLYSLRNPTYLSLLAAILALAACGKDKSSTPPPANTNPDSLKFVATNYIELAKIGRITKFRSAEGHDYSDDFESCRSMKHYFEPKGDVDWSTIAIFSPVDGQVVRTLMEWAGLQVQIKSSLHPDIHFIIFHINPADSISVGDMFTAGQRLGNHIGPQTMSDIAVGMETTGGWKLISYFDVMTDSLFQQYGARGVASREELIISKAARDADTLNCQNGQFLNRGTLENWVVLN
jgi:hypothetical protein